MDLDILSGLVLRLESDRGLSSDGTTLTSWKDTSGSGNNLSVAGNPQLTASLTPSGAAAIVLDGDEDKLERLIAQSGLPGGNQNRTIFFVVDYVDPQGVTAGMVYGDNQSNQTFGLTAAPDGDLMVQGYGGANDFDSNVAGVAGGYLVHSATLAGGQVTQYRNGTQIQSVAHNYNTDLERLVIGEEIGNAGYSKLNVSAVLVYDRALNAGERTQVETYLQQKYLIDDGLNNTPVAVGEATSVLPGASVDIDVLSNDIDDAALNGTMINIVDGPDFGTLSINPTTGVITYANTASGETDSFTYTLTDANGATSEVATVELSIEAPALSLDGFQDKLILDRTGMNGESPFFLPISMVFLPDNRMLLASKDGEVLIVDPESGANSTLIKLNNIDTGQERGLLDITLDPDFDTNGYFYLYYTPDSPEHARISRFTYKENSGGLTATANPSSEFVVWEDTDGYLSCCHYGGGLDFGPDGKLWLTTSDKFQATTPGEGGVSGGVDLPLILSSSSGKVIRVNPDGTVPDGTDGEPANPWDDPGDGINDYVWAYGLRNPFRARWDAEYGNFYIAEVGGNQQLIAHEDLHVASLDAPGAFYGWPFYEGTEGTYVNGGNSIFDPADFPDPNGGFGADPVDDFYSAPIWSLPHSGAIFDQTQNTSASLTGGEVYRGNMFPTEWDGVYFYGDYTRDYIHYLILDETGTQVLGDHAFKPSTALPGATNEVVSISVGSDGALYYAMIANGQIRRVTYSDGPANDAPDILTAGISPTGGDLPLLVTLDATVHDEEGDALTYTVNYGDGTVESAAVSGNGVISISHSYNTSGNYVISFSVSDGGHTTWYEPLRLQAGDANSPPEITGEGADVTVAESNAPVTFSATVTDPNNDTLSYTWIFGDGTSVSGTAASGDVVSATHAYANDGVYTAYLEIDDGEFTDVSSTIDVQIGDSLEVPVTNGLNLLLQSDIKIGLGSYNVVTAWLDGSGQGNNLFAQGDPRLETNRTPTGQSAIVFDGTGDLLQRVDATDTIFNLPTGNANRTMFLVVKYVDAEGVAAGLAYGDGQNNQAFGLVSKYGDDDLTLQGWGGNNDFDSNVDGPTQGWMVQSVVLSANAFSHYLNGTLIDSGTHTFATDLKKLILGGEIAGLGESRLEIGAALIYDRALNGTERQQVETFLQTKYITGTSGNTDPVAQNDSFTTAEDTVLTGNVLADNGNGADADADTGDTLQTTVVTGPTKGALVLNANGTFTYTPALNQNGPDSFVYQLSDGNGGTDQATVSIGVTPVDDLALANDDSYGTMKNTPLVVNAATGVLFNDSDVEGDAFSVTGVTVQPANGVVAMNADGSFTYTPDSGFTGQDSFTYQITGGDTGLVTVNVTNSGGGVPVTAGLVAAFEEGNVSTGAGNVVTGWSDSSGRGNDLVALGDPTLLAGATPTGRSAIAFDGTGDLLQRVNATDTLNGLPGGNANRTMFFVVDYIDAEGVAAGLVYGEGATNKAFGLVTKHTDEDLTIQGWGKNRDFDSNVDGPTQGWMVQSVVLSGNTFSHYLDGTLIDSGTNSFATSVKKLILGGEIAGYGESQIEIGAALIYDRALNDTDRMDVETYLQTTYVDDTFSFF